MSISHERITASMIEQAKELYDLWDGERVEMKPHSRLYHLEPIGVGSSMVESLTSYVTRLAEAHSVHPRVLLIDEILPLMQRFYLNPEGHVDYAHLTTFWERSTILNGNSSLTAKWVQALEQLTLRYDLHFLTLLPFTNTISPRKLLRRMQAWCPICYECWRETNLPIYAPLIWQLECVTMCIEHGQALQQRCPYKDCARLLPALAPRAQLGYCSWCNRWLGDASVERSRSSLLNSEDWKLQQWTRDLLNELFTAIPHISELSYQEGFVATIAAYITNVMGGNISASARQLDVHPRTLQKWVHGQAVPQLQNLLHLCSHLGISLLSLLTGQAVEAVVTQSHVLQEQFTGEKPKKVFRKFDVERLQCALEGVLRNPQYPPPSMRDVAKDLEYDPAHLSKRFPELCRAISQRYLTYRTEQGQQRVQKMCDEVRQTMYTLQAQGYYPSSRRVKKLLSAVLKEPEVYATWQATLKELGWR